MLLRLNQNKHVLLSDIISRENACLQEINKYKAIIKEKDHYIAKLQNLEDEINILSSGSISPLYPEAQRYLQVP